MVGKGPENWVHVSLLENFGGGVGGFRRNEVPFYYSLLLFYLYFEVVVWHVRITLDNLLLV